MNDTVTLTIPADTAHVALARTVAASMAARADLPIDQLEDVRLAVDEAVSQLVADAPAGNDVTCRFTVIGHDLDISVSAATAGGTVPPTDTFSWMVLRALVHTVSASAEAGRVTLELHITRAVAVEA